MRTVVEGKFKALLAGAMLATAVSGSALAADLSAPGQVAAKPADPAWFIRLGPAGVFFDSSAKLYTAAGQVPGASAHADDNFSGLFEFGYFFTDNIAVSLTGGVPPTTTLNGRGTAAALGALGQVTYGPATLTAHYHYKGLGNFQPYAGLGIGYAFIFGSKDGSVTNLDVKGAPAFVMQAGLDYAVNRNWSAFVDVKHLLLSVDASGNLGPTPVTARVRLDPTIVFSGIAYHF